jgi:hypothetical protein
MDTIDRNDAYTVASLDDLAKTPVQLEDRAER